MNIQAKAPVKMFETAREAIRTVAEAQKRISRSDITSHYLLFLQEVLSMNTFMANPDKIEKKWYVVDATDCTLGQTNLSLLLM